MSQIIPASQQTLTLQHAEGVSRVAIIRRALDEESQIRVMVREYIQRHMIEGVDYGTIPGTNKPTLFKPGAEKLVDLFQCTPKFSLVKFVEDFERGFFNYVFRVRLYPRDSKTVLAEGFGSANSREGRYRWRTASRKCPVCAKETIIKGKAEYGGGWLCFGKKGGCSAKFPEGAPAIENQAQGQVENDDIATLANTILKMAKKRALVDGVIALARCSDMFEQDLEDIKDAIDLSERDQQPTKPSAPPLRTVPKSESQAFDPHTGEVLEMAPAVQAPPARAQQTAPSNAGAPDPIDLFLANVAGCGTKADLDVLKRNAPLIVPKDHPRRKQVGIALNEASARVKA